MGDFFTNSSSTNSLCTFTFANVVTNNTLVPSLPSTVSPTHYILGQVSTSGVSTATFPNAVGGSVFASGTSNPLINFELRPNHSSSLNPIYTHSNPQYASTDFDDVSGTVDELFLKTGTYETRVLSHFDGDTANPVTWSPSLHFRDTSISNNKTFSYDTGSGKVTSDFFQSVNVDITRGRDTNNHSLYLKSGSSYYWVYSHSTGSSDATLAAINSSGTGVYPSLDTNGTVEIWTGRIVDLTNSDSDKNFFFVFV